MTVTGLGESVIVVTSPGTMLTTAVPEMPSCVAVMTPVTGAGLVCAVKTVVAVSPLLPYIGVVPTLVVHVGVMGTAL